MSQKTYWIVIASDGDYALGTISYTRKDAIFSWLDGTKLNWKKDSKKYGWKVQKVTIEIKALIEK
jgi:hypothetical protein